MSDGQSPDCYCAELTNVDKVTYEISKIIFSHVNNHLTLKFSKYEEAVRQTMTNAFSSLEAWILSLAMLSVVSLQVNRFILFIFKKKILASI